MAVRVDAYLKKREGDRKDEELEIRREIKELFAKSFPMLRRDRDGVGSSAIPYLLPLFPGMELPRPNERNSFVFRYKARVLKTDTPFYLRGFEHPSVVFGGYSSEQEKGLVVICPAVDYVPVALEIVREVPTKNPNFHGPSALMCRAVPRGDATFSAWLKGVADDLVAVSGAYVDLRTKLYNLRPDSALESSPETVAMRQIASQMSSLLDELL